MKIEDGKVELGIKVEDYIIAGPAVTGPEGYWAAMYNFGGPPNPFGKTIKLKRRWPTVYEEWPETRPPARKRRTKTGKKR